MSINQVNITGNLTKDSEIRVTQSGSQILNFSVAVNDRHKNQQTGNWENYPNYIGCVMFGSRAEHIQPYLVKGTKVAINGKLRYSSWEKDGQKRSKIEIIVNDIEFLSSKNSEGDVSPQSIPTSTPPVPPSADLYDQNIPF